MKRVLCILLVLILVTTCHATQNAKIFWDNSHVLKQPEIMKTGFMGPIPYKKNFLESKGYRVDWNEGKELTYEKLKEYDVLVVWVPFHLYTSEEVAAVQRFVKNGGGLIIFGEYATTLLGGIAGTSNKEGFDSLSKAFGVEYVNDFSHGCYMTFVNHPLTSNLEEILLANFGALESINPSFTPIMRTSTDKIAIGVMNYGRGRVVFSTDAFFDEHANSNACLLATNAFQWISEPGGPARYARQVQGEASTYLLRGINLFNSGKYKEAQETFYKSMGLYKKLNEIYDTDISERVRIVEQYGKRCANALQADEFSSEGQTLFSSGEFMKAREVFMQAASLYEKAGVAKSSDALNHAQKAEETQKEFERKRAEEEKRRQEEMNTSPSPSPTPQPQNQNRYAIGGFIAIIIVAALLILNPKKKIEKKEGVETEEKITEKISEEKKIEEKEEHEEEQPSDVEGKEVEEKKEEVKESVGEGEKESGEEKKMEEENKGNDGEWNGETE